MQLNRYHLRNFRRLEDVEISLEKTETIFVGSNNSGKTSATAAFKLFTLQSRNFQIHDFSSLLIPDFDNFGKTGAPPEAKKLPYIEMDLWFTLDPETEYGRVGDLLPSLQNEFAEVGIRIRFAVKDTTLLYKMYLLAHPKDRPSEQGYQQKSLSYFLSQNGNLKKYFSLQYFTLGQEKDKEITLHALDKEDGQNTLKSLLLVDYVDAQRKIDEISSSQSNKLSTIFSDFYKHNLEKQEYDSKSIEAINKSNATFTEHYQKEFLPLLDAIKGIGFPSVHDRELSVVSKLTAEEALKGGLDLIYLEKDTQHTLPEAYNGLGFKNLIYLIIQIAHYQIQWIMIKENRPLCHLILIEEPEVHLHAQVQQTFIRQINNVMQEIRQRYGNISNYSPQLVITTHSSHIIAEASFNLIRYFRRIKTKFKKSESSKKFTASEILNLGNFNNEHKKPENIDFLKKFIRLTHCDLFFADAAILVEGTVEKLLMPLMIEKMASPLKASYVTILELGGSYAHQFIQLLKFINLPALIITDLDSVEFISGTKRYKTCRADKENAVSINGALKRILKKSEKPKISELLSLNQQDKILDSNGYHCFVAFQNNVSIEGSPNKGMLPRTFEEAFIYENIENVRTGNLQVFVKLSGILDFEQDYQTIYKSVKSKNYKKVEFALRQIDTNTEWKTPQYIIEGLEWLNSILNPAPRADNQNSKAEPAFKKALGTKNEN